MNRGSRGDPPKKEWVNAIGRKKKLCDSKVRKAHVVNLLERKIGWRAPPVSFPRRRFPAVGLSPSGLIATFVVSLSFSGYWNWIVSPCQCLTLPLYMPPVDATSLPAASLLLGAVTFARFFLKGSRASSPTFQGPRHPRSVESWRHRRGTAATGVCIRTSGRTCCCCCCC